MSTASLVGNDLLSCLPSSAVKNYNKSPCCFAGYFWSTLCSLPNAANYDHDSSQEVGSGSSLAKFANFKYLSITSSFICLLQRWALLHLTDVWGSLRRITTTLHSQIVEPNFFLDLFGHCYCPTLLLPEAPDRRFTFIPGFATCSVLHMSNEKGIVHYSVILLLFFVLPFSIAIFSYYHVYTKIRQHNLEMVPYLQQRMTRAGISIHEIKITKSLSVVIAGFVICWLPMWTIALLTRFRPDLIGEQSELLSTVLIFLNATINPFIYAWTSRAFRLVFWKMLFSWKSNV